MKKLIHVILTLALLLSSLSGCRVFMENQGEISNPLLQYTLDQETIDSFYALLAEAEQLAIAGEDLEATDEASERLEEIYNVLIDQYQIAYIRYCMDQSDETEKSRYLECVDMVTEAESEYNEMCKRVWLSETPFRDHLFAEWSQEEIDRLLSYNEEIAQLEKRNTELTVQFRELDGSSWETDMIPLYNEMVQNNNRIARYYGFDNYYDYASEVIYQRDYTVPEIELLRSFVAEYLVDAHRNSAEAFMTLYGDLDKNDSKFLSHYIYEDYDGLEENYVMNYIADLPDSAEAAMLSMFEEERVVFSNAKKAYPGAFTTWIGERPFCFFGPDYTNSETIVHELGHYYGADHAEPWSLPMDLAETQSQGNEWLFTHFMQSQLEEAVYQSVVEYKLQNDMGYIICFTMVDEFEQQVYSHEKAGNMTEAEYDAIMESVAQRYGGIDYVCDNILDVQTYWRQVVLESPVYYISYAVSGIAAINLFIMAQEDSQLARQCYVKLQEEPLEEEGFLANIQNAGLSGPFTETVYQKIYERYEILE